MYFKLTEDSWAQLTEETWSFLTEGRKIVC